MCFVFVKQKTAYEMRISDWSSDVCSSDLVLARWYHEGLNSFEEQLQGGRELLERFGPVINSLKSRGELDHLIEETRAVRREIAQRLHEGRDRLMEDRQSVAEGKSV